MPRRPTRVVAPRSLDLASHNLPVQLTSFIGREREIAEIKRLLPTTRLLTLTGAGGAGKTRLALRVGTDLLEEFSDGVWWVDLQRLTDPQLVPQAVASALRIPEAAGRPLIETLTEYLRRRSPLLVLDNCEHLLSACAQLTETLLQQCPEVRILATSREGLGIAGESTHSVPSLSVPDPDHLPALDRLEEYEAVRLFVERARLSEPGFQITQSNAAAVARVCQRLDGIPLAIELAAALVNVLTPEQIASRLANRFRLLTGGKRTSLRRQQTLRATMDWSYDLLTEHERTVFRRSSVFASGWTLEAAEAICSGAGIGEADILDLLAQLVRKSLVMVETQGGEKRYRLLETIREYGWEKLLESGEAEDVRRRHRDWFAALAEQADSQLIGRGRREWITRLEMEHPNLRAALEWSRDEEGGAEAEVRLAGGLGWFWYVHGDWIESRAWLEDALARSGGAPTSDLRKVLSTLVLLLIHSLEYSRAAALAERGLALCNETNDREGKAIFLSRLGLLAMHQGEDGRAKALFEASLALCREVGNKVLVAVVLGYLGNTAALQGDYKQATALHTDSLALFREAESGTSFALRNLGYVMLADGDHHRAEMLFKEGLSILREIGMRWGARELLEGLAGVASAQRRYEKAARLLGAMEAWREILADSLVSRWRKAIYEQSVASTRTGLGDAAFAAAWAAGRDMTLDQTIEYALAPEPVAADAKRLAGDQIPGSLTPREREVAVLIAQGLTNRQIATQLVITERTAESHVQHILDKLDLKSRGQITVWAIEHGLYKPSQS